MPNTPKKSVKYSLVFLAFLVCLVSTADCYSQVQLVGSGSYTTQFPGVDEAGRNGFPSGTPQLSGSAVGKPVPTNDWWSKLIKENHADNLFNYPFAMKTRNDGLVVNYIPSGVQGDAQSIVVGVSALNETKATISDYSDWTIQMDWGGKFFATAGIGMPFLYFEKAPSELALITVNQGTVTVSGEKLIVQGSGNGANYVVYAPQGSTWTESGNTYQSSLNGNDYWSLAMLPQGQGNVAAIVAEYEQYAYVFPTSTSVNWSYDEMTAEMRTDFSVSVDVKEGTASETLIGLLPHQWRHLAADSPEPQGYVYNSIRGDLRMLAGNTFSTSYSFHGILPTLPYLSNYSESFDPAELYDKVTLLENDQLSAWTDSYNEGQVMNRLIQTARIAHKMGLFEARDKMIATVKERLEDWLTVEAGEVAFLFYYNSDWTALLGYPAGHGQDGNINDHHFHWGYFIHAAAFLEQFQPGWAEDWGPMVDLLVRDAASPDREDSLFPFLRNFSPYAGHCWANGFATFPQGNDQESTSESMQFNSSLIHWGSITGNDEIRDLGIYLYTTEQAAVEEYWFDIHEEIFPENNFSLVSRVWGNSYDNGTFWTADIAASYGIELYPIHGGSMYLGHHIQYAGKLWAEIEANTGILSNEANPNLWHDTMWKYLAFTDAQKAINLYNSYPDRNLKFGISDAQTYYWLHAMNALGQVDATVTADHPLAVAFVKEGSYTYVAHNYSNQPLEVTFSTGFVLSLPPNEMATNRDLDITGTITSSFERAFPGGNVELAVEAIGSTPSRVEFYGNGVLLGEDTEAPFAWTAENLSAKIHSFYGKIYSGDYFGLTDIASVVVGEQKPFNDVRHQLPGTIEAGHFDYYEGGTGQGISYLDLSPGNNGDFRTKESVDATIVTGEGATVGWISAGEWLEYSSQVEQSGLYELQFRYASGNAAGGGPFQIEIDGRPISTSVSVATTGEWDVWQTATVGGVELPQGKHVLRVSFNNGEFNLGEMNFTRTGDLPYNPPIAEAGENISILLPGNTAQLDANGSFDADGEPLTFDWSQLYGPSIVHFSDPQVANPTISNLQEGIYGFQVMVSDGQYQAKDEMLVIVSETGNVEPTVSIASPASGDAFEAGESIQINATASDLDGSVTKVEFFEGTNKLGEDLTAPFSFLWVDVPVGTYSLTAVATDDAANTQVSEAIVITVEDVHICTETSNEAQEGAFNTGYTATFETVGTTVTVSFELLDSDRTGVVAFLREQNPFSEVPMEQVDGSVFQKSLTNRTPGETLNIACKFAFSGGLVVTKYIQYVVGSGCSGSGGLDDTSPPSAFSASIGTVSASSIELLLTASDASGSILYDVVYGSGTKSATGQSANTTSVVINQLIPNTSYTFSVSAKDAAGNIAVNSPLSISATTLVSTSTACSGTASDAQQGSFDTGYQYSFETDGTDVIVTFELLDQKEDLIAYLWRESPFAEFAMTAQGGKTFSYTLSGQSIGTTISYACKFAFKGGFSVTKYFDYVVGDDCSGEVIKVDDEPPTNFVVSKGSITFSTIEMILRADDNSGKVILSVEHNGNRDDMEVLSGVDTSYTLSGLAAATAYELTFLATDSSGNVASNSPQTMIITTLPDEQTPLGASEIVDFTVYPNPSTSELTINWMHFIRGSLFTTAGKRVVEFTEQTVSMKNLAPGVYLMILEGKNEKLVEARIVKK